MLQAKKGDFSPYVANFHVCVQVLRWVTICISGPCLAGQMRTVRTVELEKEEFISFFTMGRNVFVLHSHCVMQTDCLAFLTSGHQNPLPAGQIQLHTLSAKHKTSIYTTLLLVEYDIVNLS